MQTISNADKTLLQGYAPVHLHLYVGGALIPAKLGSFQLTQSVGDEETTCGSSVASNVTFTADAEPIVRVLATHLDEAITTHDDEALVARFSWRQLVGLTCKFTWDVDGSTEYDLFTGKIEKTVVSGGRVTVTAQDELFWNGSKAFSNQSSYQTDSNASTVFSTIASIMGVSVNSATSTLLSSITISGGFSSCRDTLTCAEAAGHIAGLVGGNAVITRDGKLAIVKYHAVNFETEPYSGEASAENYDYTVSGVNFSRTYITNVTNPDGTKSESESLVNYKAGDGYLSMENPLANQAAANRAYNALRTFSSRKGSYSFPMGIELEPGDIITIHSMDGDYPVAINTIELALDGGVKTTVHGAGQMYPNGVNGSILQQTRMLMRSAGLMRSVGDEDDEDPVDEKPDAFVPGRTGVITQRLDSLELEMLRVKNLQAENADITNANIQTLRTETITADRIDVDGLFAENITATGEFQVNNSAWTLVQNTYGLSLNSKTSVPEGFESPSSLGVWDAVAILNGREDCFITGGSSVTIESPDIWFSIGTPKPSSNGGLGLGNQSYRWGTLYTTTNPNVSSDRNVKRDITEEVPDIVDKLVPVSYKRKGGSDRIHYGFIAQDVEDALEQSGTDTSNLGLVTYDTDSSGAKRNYALSYDELIPILVAKIQNQQKQIDALAERLDRLEKGVK